MANADTTATYNGRRSPRDFLKQGAKLAPFARYVPKNPALLGAALVGLVGVLAWRNREKIAETARPLLDSAAERGAALKEKLPFGRAERETA